MTKHKTRANRMHRQVVHTCECPTCRQYPSGRIAREHRAINRLIAAADERTRRLTAGLLARLHGRGGISLLARISGLHRNTVARGRREMRQPCRQSARIRRSGGGGQYVEKKSRRS